MQGVWISYVLSSYCLCLCDALGIVCVRVRAKLPWWEFYYSNQWFACLASYTLLNDSLVSHPSFFFFFSSDTYEQKRLLLD